MKDQSRRSFLIIWMHVSSLTTKRLSGCATIIIRASLSRFIVCCKSAVMWRNSRCYWQLAWNGLSAWICAINSYIVTVVPKYTGPFLCLAHQYNLFIVIKSSLHVECKDLACCCWCSAICVPVCLLDCVIMSCAKTTERVEMPFGMWTQVCTRNCALGGGRIGLGEEAILGLLPCDAAFCLWQYCFSLITLIASCFLYSVVIVYLVL